jgi:hypothetical protein
MENLGKELSALLNMHSQENNSDTPDFILATYLLDCLNSFEKAVIIRERWYGKGQPDDSVSLPKDSVSYLKPCPNPECGAECQMMLFPDNGDHFVCCEYCGYDGPLCKTESEAVRLHNLIAGETEWK